MVYSVRRMSGEDIAQVTEIDREAFHTQWPPPNYQNELQNRLARYIVACDETKTTEEPEVKTYPEKGLSGLASRVSRWFNLERLLGNELPPAGRQYI